MSLFTTHSIESAPTGSKAILDGARKSLGFVPNLYANLAESPAALKAYTDIAVKFIRTAISS